MFESERFGEDKISIILAQYVLERHLFLTLILCYVIEEHEVPIGNV